MKLKVQFRPANPSDHPLILSSWLKGAYTHCSAFRDMPKSLYYGLHEPTVKRILQVSDCLCAVDIEEPTHVLGYIVYKHYPKMTVFHWMYVKQTFRNFGIGSNLIKATEPRINLFTSHETYDSQRFLHKRNLTHFHVPHLRHQEWYIEEFFKCTTLFGGPIEA